ncbi:MAG: peptidylprolyl isomerase [Candidatus Marinamargulisbacteria bacterium]
MISCKSEAVSTAKGDGNYVEMVTNFGSIIIELDKKKAPATVKNFINYVDSGYYDGTIFHRVIDGFMIQGGGFDEKMNKKKTQKPIMNEANNGLSNVVGTIAMARTNDPHSATSQFFINVANNTFLNYKSEKQPGYCVFGRVVEGIGVVQKIKGVAVSNFDRYQNVPEEPVMIKRVRRFTKAQLANDKGVESLKETPLPVATN